MVSKKVYIVILLLIPSICISQANQDELTTNKIKTEVTSFLLEKEQIKKAEDFNERVFIVEMVDNKVLGFNEKGLYRIGTYTSHSQVYILLKNKDEFEIVNLTNFSSALKKITTFLTSNNFNEDLIVLYLEKIITTYRNNNNNGYSEG